MLHSNVKADRAGRHGPGVARRRPWPRTCQTLTMH